MSENEVPPPKRKRSLTSLTLNWIAERMRKAQAIKEQVESGSYKVDTQKIASALVEKES